METWTLIISAAALVISLYTYFAHDRKLKQQERLINSYQLKQLVVGVVYNGQDWYF